MKETKTSVAEALKRASEVALLEHQEAERHLEEFSRKVADTAYDLEQRLGNLREQSPLVNDLRKTGLHLASELKQLLQTNVDEAKQDLAEKKAYLEKFTVALFGRTLAGKSTIREAITGGSGETIGKGAQRTTRDNRFYTWNHLTIIDTPGIAAYNGQEDADKAHSIVSKSDVLLFLLSSDSIQEDEFEALKQVYDKKKNLIFVLNVKLDLTTPIRMRQALRDTNYIFNPKILAEHHARIRKLAVDRLQIPYPEIIEVHAQSAFLANLAEYASDSAKLRALSQLGSLENVLIRELTINGAVRRLQTIYDSTIIKLDDVPDDFTKAIKDLRASSDGLRRKCNELETWLKRYKRDMPSRVANAVRTWISPMRDSLYHIVEKNIENSKLNEIIKHEFENLHLTQNCTGFAKDVEQEVKEKIDDLMRAFQSELPFMRSSLDENFDHFSAFDGNRVFGRLSAGASVLAGIATIAASVALGSFWNPVGWIAGGVAITFGIMSWFWGDRDKDRRRAVKKTMDNVTHHLDQVEASLQRELFGWFEKEVVKKAVEPALKDTITFCETLETVIRRMEEGRSQIWTILDKMNKRLLNRSLSIQGVSLPENAIMRIARIPGRVIKFIHLKDSFDAKHLKAAELQLGEKINPISGKCPENKQVALSLHPARVDPDDVFLRSGEWIVNLEADQIGLAYGKQHQNIKLAGRLFRSFIKLVSR